ncbi:hypothetical protein [Saccharopolyspora endophytica]|uniref:Uncharacterized protein n=1 Tax=Saccharopolyspora endophytica TaxID=543886 RepID=A0ABS5DAS7_9PSEU|nr:hypothetical protein [Saccharopolyspora endophytica]MBQ0923354.1 hypothetical protein [Saccharopolyspora endophytica]
MVVSAGPVEKLELRLTIGEVMITDDLSRELTPEQRSASPEVQLGRVAMTLGFTAVQLWAIFELASLNLSGAALVALVVVMAAAILVAVESWSDIVKNASAGMRSSTDLHREPN